MQRLQKFITGSISLIGDDAAPDRARLVAALGLAPNEGEFRRLVVATLLTGGRAVDSGMGLSVSVHIDPRISVCIDFDPPSLDADEAALLALAPDVQVVHSKTGLGRAYVFEREGVRCAVTVTNATNLVDGVLCEVL